MSSNNNPKTPEQLADEQRRDVMAFAYLDKDGKYYGVNEQGERVEVALGSTLPDGTKIQTLTPEFHQVAESVAAVMMSYSKQLALSDADRGILSDLFQGKDGAVDKLSSAGKQFWETTKKTLGVTDFKIPGSGIVDAAGNVIDGLKAPFTAGGTLGGLLKEMADQVGGGEIDRAHALAIGTAYASAAQAAAQSDGGFTSHPFNWINAALHFAFSYVCDLFGIDKSHEWTSWHKSVSFAEEFANANRGDDNVRIEHEMGKLSEIGGVKTGELAMLTRPESTIRATDGSQVKVNSSDSTHAAPYTPDKPALTLDDAEKKQQTEPKPNIAERELNVIKNHDYTAIKKLANDHPILTGAAVVGSTVGAYKTAKGVTQGFIKGTADQVVGDNSVSKIRSDKLATKGMQQLEEADIIEAGKAPKQMFGKNVPLTGKAGNSDKADKLRAKGEANIAKAEESFSHATTRDETLGKAEPLFSSGKTLTEIANEPMAATNSTTLIGKGFDKIEGVSRWVGRKTGEGFGKAADVAIAAGEKYAPRTMELLGDCAPAFKVGGKVLGAGIAPLLSSGQLIYGLHTGDKRMITTATTECVTIGSCVAAGAAIGAVGGVGIFDWATIPAGALGGLIYGGLTSLVTGWGAGKIYDKYNPEKPGSSASQDAATTQNAPINARDVEVDEGIAALMKKDDAVVKIMEAHPDMVDTLRTTHDETLWRETANKLIGMSGHTLSFGGVTFGGVTGVTIGANIAAPASTPNAPVNHPSQPSTMIFS